MITYLGIGLLALFLSSLTRDLLNKVVGVVVSLSPFVKAVRRLNFNRRWVVYLSKTKWVHSICYSILDVKVVVILLRLASLFRFTSIVFVYERQLLKYTYINNLVHQTFKKQTIGVLVYLQKEIGSGSALRLSSKGYRLLLSLISLDNLITPYHFISFSLKDKQYITTYQFFLCFQYLISLYGLLTLLLQSCIVSVLNNRLYVLYKQIILFRIMCITLRIFLLDYYVSFILNEMTIKYRVILWEILILLLQQTELNRSTSCYLVIDLLSYIQSKSFI